MSIPTDIGMVKKIRIKNVEETIIRKGLGRRIVIEEGTMSLPKRQSLGGRGNQIQSLTGPGK